MTWTTFTTPVKEYSTILAKATTSRHLQTKLLLDADDINRSGRALKKPQTYQQGSVCVWNTPLATY